jgi:glycosyltransferase involved in cell wall biosynthesis
MNICLVIPHYDHLDQFSRVLPELVGLNMPMIIVDDASPAPVSDHLEQLLQNSAARATLVKHEHNLGKGGAVMTGLQQASLAGYSHALQVDADGQHDLKSIPKLLRVAHEHPQNIICGRPVFDNSISGLRYYGRFLTLYLVWLETLSKEIEDALCGFRIYPLESVVSLIVSGKPGERMAFDPEILVRAVWSGIGLSYIPVNIVYPDDGKSHFHYIRDNAEITWMHTRLIAGMLLRLPKLVRRLFERKTVRQQS